MARTEHRLANSATSPQAVNGDLYEIHLQILVKLIVDSDTRVTQRFTTGGQGGIVSVSDTLNATLSHALIPVPADNPIQEYRECLAAATPPFLLARRFVAAESWTKASTQDGIRYLGLFREQEPDLPTILTHRVLLILGEPGAGKSTTARAIAQHVLDNGQANAIPVIVSLKSYRANLRNLLLRTVPAKVLDALELARTYILDGVDEVAAEHRSTLPGELNDLLTTDNNARLILTARQAFAAQHADALPTGTTTYHLLDFDDEDIKALTTHQGINIEEFRNAVHDAECEEEIRNPFVLTVLLERYKAHGQLSRLRSDNVAYVVTRLIQSRPLFNATRQQRALRMLAVAAETAARNELTEEEALRILLDAIEFPPATARQLLDELSQSILIRMPGGISFQMRSYGEYLAAEELHDAPLDRLKELAFVGDAPVDTWQNTVTYLAEMNDKIRAYFATHHPEWLINVSPTAFSEDERTALTRRLVTLTNAAKAYLVDEERFSLRRLARLLTPSVITELRAQLASTNPHEVANALVLLGIRQEPAIAPHALRLVTEHRSASTVRYSAIIALINTGENAVIKDLIAFADQSDPYYINIIDAIGSLCTPADFPSVLPLLERSNAGLSSAYYHFRELNTKEALTAAIAYLTHQPRALDGHDLDSYLEPIVDLLPAHWDEQLASSVGLLLAAAEREHLFLQRDKLPTKILQHAGAKDHQGTVMQAMLRSLATDGTRLRHLCHLTAPLVNLRVAHWIKDHAPQYAQDFFPWLPPGPSRDVLDPRSPDVKRAHEETIAAQHAEERQREDRATTTRTQHQNTIRTSRDINRIIIVAERLQKEHWPELAAEQRSWLAQAANDTLARYDLARSITWENENRWTRPHGLNPLLHLIDYYQLHLSDDVSIVLALRSWPDQAIANYYRREGFTQAAKEQLNQLLHSAENHNITQHVLSFLRQTPYDTPIIRDLLRQHALDTTAPIAVRTEATECLTRREPATETLLTLARDQEPAIREQAFRELIKQQHRATIQRALATLTDDDLRNAEVPIPNSTPLDWIGKITSEFALDDLRALRLRSMAQELWRITNLLTGTIANIDKNRAAAVINQQLPHTPPAWQAHYRQEADKLQRAARIQAVQQTPLDALIRKLKGATSMIRVKIWCEGPTDRPVLRKLFNDGGEAEIATTMDFVGGWANLISETEPERWLDGCRQAVIIMDGDVGRKLKKNKRPLTEEAKKVQRRFAQHPLTLYVLQRYGIENYLPQHAYETVLARNLTWYFPLPETTSIEKHFCEPLTFWRRLRNWLLRRRNPSFYQKHQNEEVAAHTTTADIAGTDLASIIDDVKQKAAASRTF